MPNLSILKYKKRLVLDQYSELLDNINSDLNLLSSILKGGAQFKINSNDLDNAINKIIAVSNYQSLSQEKRNELHKKLRLYALLLRDLVDQDLVDADPDELKEIIELIESQLGTVPKLNSNINLPSAEFLPEDIKIKIDNWKKVLIENPSRTGPCAINFIKKSDEISSAPRTEILKAADKDRIKFINLTENDDEKRNFIYLSYIDFDYYQAGLFHVDHFQSAISLFEAGKEMIEAMRYSPKFCAEMS